MTSDTGNSQDQVVDGAIGYVTVVLNSVALYNVIELIFVIWGYFKRYSGLYFWAFIVSTYGVAAYCTGFLLKSKVPQSGSYLYVSFIAVGWMAMVTGQSTVLWSRLHLVLRDDFKLKLIMYMIIFNAIAMHIPTVAMVYGANSDNPGPWVKPYSIYEKIQVSVFFLQEITISSFYIGETLKLSRLQTAIQNGKRWRRLVIHLIVVNVIIILLDATILGLEYSNCYVLQTSYKGLAYSIKLKLEFTILNRLKELTTGTKDLSYGTYSGSDSRCRQESIVPSTEVGDFGGEPSIHRPRPVVSCRAFARGGNGHHDPEKGQNAGERRRENEVVMTTEVVIHRENRSQEIRDGGEAGHDAFAMGPDRNPDNGEVPRS